MDVITQGMLGCVLAQSAAKPGEIRQASVIGALSGLLADADVLIRSSEDPLLTIEYHRHFTHSIFFIPFGALIAALILWPFVRKQMIFQRLYLFSLLGYSLSGFIDACTSYGTHLFWPLIPSPVSFHIISIIDPVFTLGLIIAVIFSLRVRTNKAAHIGLVFAGIYLLVGWAQLQRAESVAQGLASERGHTIEKGVVKPTLANLLVWRSIYQFDEKLYVDAVRVGIFNAPRVYRGGSVTLFRPERGRGDLKVDSVLYQDILRFSEFSRGFVAVYPGHPRVLADMRYSNQPTGIEPLWGIELDIDHPEQHARYRFFRDLSEEKRRRYFSMLQGKDISD